MKNSRKRQPDRVSASPSPVRQRALLTVVAVALASLAAWVWSGPLELWYLGRGPTAGLEAYAVSHPESRGAEEALGRAYLRDGRPAEAARVLGPEVEKAPADAPLRVLLARALLASGRAADAYAHLQVVLGTLHSDDPDAHYWLGQTLERTGRSDRARGEYQEVLRKRPRDVPSLVRLAALAIADSGTTAAEAYLRRAVAADPRNVQAGTMLSQQLFKLGRADEAAAEARRVLLVRPGDPQASFWLARATLLKDPRGNGAEAEGALRAAERGPESWEARYYLAKLLRAQGRTAEAVSELQTAVREDPLYKDAYYDLAMTQTALGQSEAAAGSMQQFRRLQKIDEEGSTLEYQVWADPRSVALGERLARFYLGTHRPDLARPQVERLLRSHPGDAGLKRLRAEVEAAAASQEAPKR